jgi:VCBS repeat-containing protein
VKYTYFVRARFTDGSTSGPSNTVTIVVVNDAPVAAADNYTVTTGAVLTVTAAGVLANDTDDDSPLTSLTARLAVAPSHGSLVLNANGAFTYTPAKNFTGTDTFKYYALDVTPLSSANVAATVTIKVKAKDNYKDKD